MKRNRIGVAALSLAAALLVAGCGLTDGPSQPTAADGVAVDNRSVVKEDSRPAFRLEGHDDAAPYTPPGSSLPAGSSVVIPVWNVYFVEPLVESSGVKAFGDHVVSVQVDGVRSGSIEDLAEEFQQADLDKIVDYDIYYIDFTSRVDQGDTVPLSAYWPLLNDPPVIDAVDVNGKIVTGNFTFYDLGPDACPRARLIDLVQTQKADGCVVALLEKGATIDHFVYLGYLLPESAEGLADPYRLEPITIAAS